MTTYQDVLQAIRDGEDAADVEAMIADDKAALTDEQMADLRAELRGLRVAPMTTKLPTDLRAAYEWTSAAGELDELRRLETDEDLTTYCTLSEENARAHGDRSVSADDLMRLHAWLRANA